MTIDRFARWRPWTRGILLANVIAQVVIIVTGGIVRLTASGLGCTTWPNCTPGQFTPEYHEATTYHAFVEFGNRTLTVVLIVIAVAVVLLVCTDRARSWRYRSLGAVPLILIAAQAVIGGVVVRLELSPAWVSLHMAVSALLVWCSAWLLGRFGESDGPAVSIAGMPTRAAGWVMGLLLIPVVSLGIVTSGSGPHSGDDKVAYRFALDPHDVTRAHSAAVYLFCGAGVALGVLLYRERRADAARRHAGLAPGDTTLFAVASRTLMTSAIKAGWILAAITVLQGAIGYTQYFTGLPWVLVNVHMLGAALLIWATANTVLHLRTRW
jgi:cytochrome c oxidase assembly protein subunit 15